MGREKKREREREVGMSGRQIDRQTENGALAEQLQDRKPKSTRQKYQR